MTEREWNRRCRSVTNALVAAKAELGALGLFRSMHALDEGMKPLGYEQGEIKLRIVKHGWRKGGPRGVER